MRYGMVAIADGAQRKPLSLLFDRARVQEHQLGPVGEVAPAETVAAPVTASRVPRHNVSRGLLGKVRAARKLRRCVKRALTTLIRGGKTGSLPRAARRCVRRYASPAPGLSS
jgi:hypothetical protein